MKEHIGPAIRLTIVLAVLTCGVYPLLVWGIGQLAFPEKANGSLVVRDGKVIGSRLIGQSFTSDRYFHSRPDHHNAMASGGSNLGPTSRKLRDRIAADIHVTRTGGVPADAVTTSGSGLDPHISPANARAQAARVARANDLPLAQVNRMIDERIEGRFLGIYGEPRVNVLELNLALWSAEATPPLSNARQ